MARRLTSVNSTKGTKLSRKNEDFRIAIVDKLENGYEIKDMDREDAKNLHRFVEETVGKGMSISEVDRRYLRKKDFQITDADQKSIVHYGKDGSTFRIFGYYNSDAYFVLTRIDGKHSTHRS